MTKTEILKTLRSKYPNHPWTVHIHDLGFFIGHDDFPAEWGINYMNSSDRSDAELKKSIKRMASEWLERVST